MMEIQKPKSPTKATKLGWRLIGLCLILMARAIYDSDFTGGLILFLCLVIILIATHVLIKLYSYPSDDDGDAGSKSNLQENKKWEELER